MEVRVDNAQYWTECMACLAIHDGIFLVVPVVPVFFGQELQEIQEKELIRWREDKMSK